MTALEKRDRKVNDAILAHLQPDVSSLTSELMVGRSIEGLCIATEIMWEIKT